MSNTSANETTWLPKPAPELTSAVVSEPLTANSRIRFEFLDGLRAVAALYVVFHHSYQELTYRAGGGVIPHRLLQGLRFLDFGHYAVDVFIVLSGYCLMLPVARASDGSLRGGVRQYIARRARRILPPFYAAVAASLLLVTLKIRVLGNPDHIELGSLFSARVLGSHLLVVQNLVPGSLYQLDPPLWSVATEWQIYFLFPLLLLPVWRRFGVTAALSSGILVGVGLHLAWPSFFASAAPWFLGLFAMGMAAAVITVRSDGRYDWSRKFSWATAAWATAGGFLAFGAIKQGWFQQHRAIADIIAGAAATALIVACANSALDATTATELGDSRRPLLVLRFLGSRWLVAIGAFSYSLYLIHYPILQICHIMLIGTGVHPIARCALMLTAVPLLVLGAAYLFHLAFERRFMTMTMQPKAREDVNVTRCMAEASHAHGRAREPGISSRS